MKKLNKKGQTEDFLADLIPSAIIILIGLYVLSNMHEVNRSSATEKEEAISTALKSERTTILDYLSLKVDVDDKKMTMQELISLGYQNQEYQSKLALWFDKMGLAQLESPVEAISPGTKQEPVEAIQFGGKECIQMNIQYPDGSSPLKIGKDCKGIEQTFYLPTFEGQYLEIKSVVGTKD